MFHKSKIDLSESIRKSSVTLLQECLFYSIDLSLQVKQAHWNCKGRTFIAFHKYLDELHGIICDHVDLIAERITALGARAEGTLQAISKNSRLDPYPLEAISIEDHTKALILSLSKVGAKVRKAIETSAEHEDAGTSDIFTEISRSLDHHLWLLEAHQ